jgi:hypothetical protein
MKAESAMTNPHLKYPRNQPAINGIVKSCADGQLECADTLAASR